VPEARDRAGYRAVEFGWPYTEVLRTLSLTAGRLGIELLRFSEMSVDEVARECHLTPLQARLAKLREYGERFRMLDPRETTRSRLVRALKAAGLRCVTGERFDDVGRAVDAGVGVSLLYNLYQRAYGGVLKVGLVGPMGADVSRLASHRVIAVDADETKGGVDVASWADAIVDIVVALRRQESSTPATMREAQR
jgi:predicted mannosyl-3-phosphoglycerate phosphatase (HAD superfamily)